MFALVDAQKKSILFLNALSLFTSDTYWQTRKYMSCKDFNHLFYLLLLEAVAVRPTSQAMKTASLSVWCSMSWQNGIKMSFGNSRRFSFLMHFEKFEQRTHNINCQFIVYLSRWQNAQTKLRNVHEDSQLSSQFSKRKTHTLLNDELVEYISLLPLMANISSDALQSLLYLAPRANLQICFHLLICPLDIF